MSRPGRVSKVFGPIGKFCIRVRTFYPDVGQTPRLDGCALSFVAHACSTIRADSPTRGKRTLGRHQFEKHEVGRSYLEERLASK